HLFISSVLTKIFNRTQVIWACRRKKCTPKIIVHRRQAIRCNVFALLGTGCIANALPLVAVSVVPLLQNSCKRFPLLSFTQAIIGKYNFMNFNNIL
ncbi:hypothetical protein, partial [Flavobacterium sp.]|uniref:hypothetical protein n=1 Tax=Flavobacterium sp. TaxID=239 RepID=UPI003B9B3BA2